MRRFLAIALHDLRLIFMERSIWLNLVVLPIVIAFAVGIANGAFQSGDSTGPRVRVDVINEDAGPHGTALLERMRAANASLFFCPMDNDEADSCGLNGEALTTDLVQERLTEQTALALIQIPTSFSEHLEAGETANLIYRSNENTAAPGYILQALQSAAQQISGAQVAVQVGMEIADGLPFLRFADEAERTAFESTLRELAAESWQEPPARVSFSTSQSGATNSNVSGFNQSIPGIGSMYVMFALFPAAAALMRERRQGTFQRTLTMPVRRAELLGGKMAARFVVGMVQYAVLFGFGALLGVRFGGAPVALIALMVAFVLCITALTFLLATFLRTEPQAQVVALFATMTLAPLGGAWWPLTFVPEWLRIVGHLNPVAWVMDGFNTLQYTGAGFEGILTPLAVLLGMTALFFVAGVARFKFE